MTRSASDLNVVKVGGANAELLLTTVGGGAAVHLAKRCEPKEPGRSAIDEDYVDRGYVLWTPTILNYDQQELLEPCWSAFTLCGREWVTMVGGDGGPVHKWDEPALAPTCRRCLTLMDKLFPDPIPDRRLPLIVKIVTDFVLEHGYAEIHGVPGDQQAALRRLVRGNVKRATGFGCTSHAQDSIVIFVCEPIHDRHASEHARSAAEAVSQLVLTGELPQVSPPWRTAWAAWDTE